MADAREVYTGGEENTEMEWNEENSQERDKNDKLRGKKNRKFDMEFKLAVVKYAEQHSGEAAAREFNVDPRRVREWKKKKGEMASQAATDAKRLRLSGGGRKKKSEELENNLCKWIHQTRGRNLRVSRTMIIRKAKELYTTAGDKRGGDAFGATNGWLDRFLRRNNFSHKRRTTIAQKEAPIEKQVNCAICSSHQMESKKMQPKNIIAMDETAARFDMPKHTREIRCQAGLVNTQHAAEQADIKLNIKQQAMPSLKLISATDTQYSAAVLKSMNEQRNHGLFCDVTIIIQDKKFRAHKTILSASSTYFHQLFSVAGQVIELNFIRAEIFEEILNYIYTSKIVRVRSDMLEELINAGQILGVKFIANLGSPLSQVKGLPGLSKETESKAEMMPIITESFSISAEEFNQTSRVGGNDEDSDSDVMFVSQTDAQTRAASQKSSSGEIIDLDTADSENAASTQTESNHTAAKPKEKEKAKPPLKSSAPKPPSISSTNTSLPNRSPLRSPDSSSNNSSSPARVSSGSAPTTPARSSSFTPEPSSASQSSESSDIMGVHKKQVSASSQQGDFKIRIVDVDGGETNQTNSPKSAIAAKKTVTLNTATEIDSISSGCKVYANIGEDTYDIVPVKEDPGEGGSKSSKGKRSLMATPIKPFDKTPMSQKGSPNKKKAKTELEDHYELIMDGKTFYVCIVCKRPYVCLTSLRRHFNTHSWEKKYPCRYCNKVFALAEYRTKHEIHHTGERRYQCLVCNDMFMNYQLLSTHCKQVHNQDPSGRKEKDETDNNLYRLLPCKTVQMRPYSWSTEGQGVPVISEDGSVHHITSVSEDVHSSTQSRMLNWDDIFIEPDAHMPPDAHGRPASAMNSPTQGATEFDFVIPETY
ncbi:transcriptional regulator Kaiso isoform X1 [Epinephelus fuscoguttatus]|uniref:transcriptional regulator Kaiso isoform X1 n=1 Tax=Epinephelus fuscoguttatus TaxID=293821 RepID=UPI0020D0E9B1|nr:transcriptional regulator Kaiso isoform X1 [Epinephelus fuscoguttatus]